MSFEMLTQKQKIIGVVGIIVVAIIIGYYYFTSTKEVYGFDDFEEESQENEVENVENEQNTIIVHITGAVVNEGIVQVKENARINDAIEAAGGVREDADLTNVNLAYTIEDGQKIYIPYKNDAPEDGGSEIQGQVVIQGAGNDIVDGENAGIGTETTAGLVNINTANVEKLDELPGIGSSTAEKIIAYRKENGKFKSIDEIKNVSGIGEAKFEKIKGKICVWIIEKLVKKKIIFSMVAFKK